MNTSSSKSIFASALLLAYGSVFAQPDLGIARYNGNGELLMPADTAHWIHAGSVLGGRYGEEGATLQFDPANPGATGVVQVEPSAFRYFMEHGEYADGTMFLLSFYRSEAKSDPQLTGFVQGSLLQQEIHVIDKNRFGEARAFFIFNVGQYSSARVPDGSDCVACHSSEGALDGTFTQFYPVLRDRLGN